MPQNEVAEHTEVRNPRHGCAHSREEENVREREEQNRLGQRPSEVRARCDPDYSCSEHVVGEE